MTILLPNKYDFSYKTHCIDTVVDPIKQLRLDHNTLNRRVEFLETENKEQKEDIQFLLSIQHSKPQQNDAIKKHLYSHSERIDNFMEMMPWKKRIKRPVRLFPENLLR